MLLTVYTLPQLAVSAKLLCLLMVVICGAVPSMVRSVRLYNDCSLSYMEINMKGRVLAIESEDDSYQNLTIKAMDSNVALMIYAEASKRFLCFNRKWKPVGLKNFNKKMCLFYEEMLSSGYTRFRSANQSHFVGFNKRGKPLQGNASKPNSKVEKCFNFVKNDTNFNINQHNLKLAGGNNQSSGMPVFPNRGSRRGPKRSRNDNARVRHSRNKKRPS